MTIDTPEAGPRITLVGDLHAYPFVLRLSKGEQAFAGTRTRHRNALS